MKITPEAIAYINDVLNKNKKYVGITAIANKVQFIEHFVGRHTIIEEDIGFCCFPKTFGLFKNAVIDVKDGQLFLE